MATVGTQYPQLGSGPFCSCLPSLTSSVERSVTFGPVFGRVQDQHDAERRWVRRLRKQAEKEVVNPSRMAALDASRASVRFTSTLRSFQSHMGLWASPILMDTI